MTTIPSRPAIRATGLRKSFGDQPVLDGIDLDVPEGRAEQDPEASTWSSVRVRR